MGNLWWMSFCDQDRPKGQQFLGVCIVEENDFREAVKKSHALGINPGGEIQGYFSDGIEESEKTKWKTHANKLLSKNDLIELDLI